MNLRFHQNFETAPAVSKRTFLEIAGCRATSVKSVDEIEDGKVEDDPIVSRLCLLLDDLPKKERAKLVHQLCKRECIDLISPVENIWLERILDVIDSGKGRSNADLFAFGSYYFSREEGAELFRVRLVNSFLSDRGCQITSVSAVADQLAKGEQSFLELTKEKSAGEKLFKISSAGFRRVKNAFFRSSDWEEAQLFV